MTTTLETLRGPEAGTLFPLTRERTVLGRQIDCAIVLTGKQVSRQHAQIMLRDGQAEVEDLGSSNGTFLNGQRLAPHRPAPLTPRDELQIGPYFFGLRPEPSSVSKPPSEPALVIRETVNATSIHQTLLSQDPVTAHIPVIALSANALPADVERGHAVGFFRYLTKPIKVDEFMQTLDAALAQTRTRR